MGKIGLYIKNSNGNVGIGTSDPLAALDLSGDKDAWGFTGMRIKSKDLGGAPGIVFEGPTDVHPYSAAIGLSVTSGQFTDDSMPGDIVLRSSTNSDIRLSTIENSGEIKTRLLVRDNFDGESTMELRSDRQANFILAGAGDGIQTYSSLSLSDTSIDTKVNSWAIVHKKMIGDPIQDTFAIVYWKDYVMTKPFQIFPDQKAVFSKEVFANKFCFNGGGCLVAIN